MATLLVPPGAALNLAKNRSRKKPIFASFRNFFLRVFFSCERKKIFACKKKFLRAKKNFCGKKKFFASQKKFLRAKKNFCGPKKIFASQKSFFCEFFIFLRDIKNKWEPQNLNAKSPISHSKLSSVFLQTIQQVLVKISKLAPFFKLAKIFLPYILFKIQYNNT